MYKNIRREHSGCSKFYTENQKKSIQRKSAFTLAEVMIVLVIIAFVSLMMGLIIIQRYQETHTVAQLRKSYAFVSSVFAKAVLTSGPVSSWDKNNSTQVFAYLKPHISFMTDCGASSTDKRCVVEKYGRLNNSGTDGGYTDKRYYKTLLPDGSAFSFRVDDPECKQVKGTNEHLKHVCGIAFIDVNGPKKPNVAGKDKFEFYFTNYGIYPRGGQYETSASKLDGSDGCSNTTKKGYGCSAWVITVGNMDYLHKTVTWN